MDIEIKTWLFDVLNSINEIESYFIDKPKLFSEYQNDLKTKRAIERNIEIIGEAMNRIMLKNQNIEHEFQKNCRYKKSNYSWL